MGWTTVQAWFYSWYRQRIFHFYKVPRLPLGPTQPPNQLVPAGAFPRKETGRCVKLTTHPHLLVLRLRTSGVNFHFPLCL